MVSLLAGLKVGRILQSTPPQAFRSAATPVESTTPVPAISDTAAASLSAAESSVAHGGFTAFLESLEGVAAHDLPDLWSMCCTAFPPTSEWHAALLDRWAEVDPEAGLQALVGHEFDAATFSALRMTLFTAWAGYRPQAAAAALTRIPAEAPGRAELVAAVLTAVASEHPAVFLREAAAMNDKNIPDTHFR